MIIVYRYPIQKVVIPLFRDLVVKGNLEAKFNVIDTEIIRNRIAQPKTDIDEKVKYHIDNGLLISDVYFIDLLFQEWSPDKTNIIVDFPRNTKQFNSLKFHLRKRNEEIDKIIYYKINDYNKIYDIAQNKYGKFYDTETKKQTIKHMIEYEKRNEKMIEKLGELPIIQLDIMDENTHFLNE